MKKYAQTRLISICFLFRPNLAILSVYFKELSSIQITQVKSDNAVNLLCKLLPKQVIVVQSE